MALQKKFLDNRCSTTLLTKSRYIAISLSIQGIGWNAIVILLSQLSDSTPPLRWPWNDVSRRHLYLYNDLESTPCLAGKTLTAMEIQEEDYSYPFVRYCFVDAELS